MRTGDVLAERFELLEEAGSGGMATVYRARDRHTGEPVAVKVMRGTQVPDAERFQREARLLAELQHPGIVRYVAHGMTPSAERYLAMEWLEGLDVARYVAQRGELTLAESVKLTIRVAEVLAPAHRRNVIHRDLKPSNLFLVGGDLARLKLLDFGLARPTVEASDVTLTGVIVGTPSYMSPEQVRAGADLDTRSDVYALGCLLFFLVSGRPPLVESNQQALLARIVGDTAPPLRSVCVDASEELERIVARMLAKNPDARPRDASEVAHLFEEIHTDRDERTTQRRAAITRTELRLVCTIVAGPPSDSPDGEITPPRFSLVELRDIAERFGGRAETLETLATVSFSTTGSSTDLAVRAARCALAMRSLLPRAQIVVSTSWGEETTQRFSTSTNVASCAIELLAIAQSRFPSVGRDPDVAPFVVLDEMTAGLLDTRFDVHVTLPVFELRAEREQNVPVRTLLGRPSPFLGREREITTLRALYDECAGEPVSRAAIVTGAAGLGKSRLRFEFVRTLGEADPEAAVWSMRGDSISSGAPLGLIVPLLRQISGVVDGEPPTTQRSRLRARVARAVPKPDRERVEEFLAELIGLPPQPDESIALKVARRDAVCLNDQMRRAWEDLVRAECRLHPLVLMIEDLHWGDLPTLKWIDSALRSLADQPFMVIAFARPEVHDSFPALWRDRGVQEIRLSPLTRRAAEALVRNALGPTAPEEHVSRLVEQAGGNAFYLEELVRAAVAGDDRAPGTVLAMVQERVEALDPEARRVLRAASVFGQVFWRAGVATLLGGDASAPELDRWLEHLCDREVIFRSGEMRFRGEVEYSFRHALLRDGAYGMLTDRDRTIGHRLVAEWLENMGEHRARTLAEHFERGDDRPRAARWFLAAAEQAWEANDFGAVITFATRTAELEPVDNLIRGHARRLQAEAHRWRGEHAEALRIGLDAFQLLPPGTPAWYAAAGETGGAASRLGDDARTLEMVDALCASEPSVESIPAFVVAASTCFVPLLGAGRRIEADRLLERVSKYAEPLAGADGIVAARMHRIRGHRALVDGDVAEYLWLTDLAARECESAGAFRDAASLGSVLGYAWSLVGHPEEAERVLRDVLDRTDRLGVPGLAPVARHNLGWVVALQGRFDEGLAIERTALDEAIRLNDKRLEIPARSYVARILAMMGRWEEACEDLLEVIAVANAPSRARAQGAMARALVQLGRGDQALAVAHEALATLEQLGSIEEGESLIRLAYAEALYACGFVDDANEAIAKACDRLVQRAAAISDPALREGFLERVIENFTTMDRARQWSA